MGPANLKMSSEGMGNVVKAMQIDAITSNTHISVIIRWYVVDSFGLDSRIEFKIKKEDIVDNIADIIVRIYPALASVSSTRNVELIEGNDETLFSSLGEKFIVCGIG
jgi:hypothetical protein